MSSRSGKKSRIIMSCDSSSISSGSNSDGGVEVYSVQDDTTSNSSDDSSSEMLDFDQMWDKQISKQQQGVNLATQPSVPFEKKKGKPAGTPVPKRILTNKNATVETPESLKLSQPSLEEEDKKPVAKKQAPKVSLSPQKQAEKDNDASSSKVKPGSRVTMLEAVVTNATAAKNGGNNEKKNVSDTAKNDNHKKQSEEKSTTKTKKSPSDSNGVANPKENKKEKGSTEKPKSTKSLASAKPVSENKDKQKSKKRKSQTNGKDVGNSKQEKSNTDKSSKTKKDSTESSKPSSSKKAKVKKDSSKSSSSPSKPAKSSSSVDKEPAAATKPKDTATQTKPLVAAKRKSPPIESTAPSTITTIQPPKKKLKKRTFQQELLFQMLMSCKPYTLKALAHSLNSTEAAIHHVMLSLVDKKIVFKKEFTTKNGRTKELYWANQDTTAKQVTSLELPSVETINATKEDYASYKAKNSLLTRELALVQQEPSNEDLDKKLAKLEEAVNVAQTQVKETKERIAAASKQHGGKPSNSRILKKRINHMRDEWKKRKTKTMDFVDILADGMEKPPKAVVKLMELETDEMEGVTMPPKHEV